MDRLLTSKVLLRQRGSREERNLSTAYSHKFGISGNDRIWNLVPTQQSELATDMSRPARMIMRAGENVIVAEHEVTRE